MDRSKVEGLVDQETRQCRNVAYFSFESKVSAPLAWFGQLLSADLVTTHITTATTRPQSKNFRTPSSNLDLDFDHHPQASLDSFVMSEAMEPTELSPVESEHHIKEAEGLLNEISCGRKESDAKLEEIISSSRPDPFALYECSFEGFVADLSEPVVVPKTKGALCSLITEEILAAIRIQGGLKAYCREINNNHHEFSRGFLDAETESTNVAVAQLDNVKDHLKAVLQEISEAGHDDHDVHDDLRAAYSHAVPWIRRYRQVAIHSHVFYKINVSHHEATVIYTTSD